MEPVTAPATESIDPWPPHRQANYALGVMVVAFAFSFLDRVILSMLMLPIQQELNFTDVQLALLHGFAFAVFYALAGLPLGKLADTISRKHLIAFGISIWSLCTAACGLARGFGSLFLARVGVGIGEAALSPSAFSILSDYFPPERRGRAIATYQLGVTGGAGLAYILGGLVIAFAQSGNAINVFGFGELSAWRVTFMLVGLPGLLVALFALTIKEPRRREVAVSSPAGNEALAGWLRQNWRAMTFYSLGFASINVAFNALIAWGPAWLTRVHELEPAQIGFLLGAVMLFAGGTGQLLGARRSDKLFARGRRTAVVDTGLLCALALIPLSIGMIVPVLGFAVVLVGGMLFAACAAIGHAPSLIGQIAPNGLRGQVSAIFLFALNVIGTGVGPFAVAMLTDHVFADPKMVGISMTITALTGAVVGAILLWAGSGAVRQSAERLAVAVEGEIR